jgi:hypothetical protein
MKIRLLWRQEVPVAPAAGLRKIKSRQWRVPPLRGKRSKIQLKHLAGLAGLKARQGPPRPGKGRQMR